MRLIIDRTEVRLYDTKIALTVHQQVHYVEERKVIIIHVMDVVDGNECSVLVTKVAEYLPSCRP